MADENEATYPAADERPSSLRRLLIIGAPVLLVLLAAYWFGLRTRYEPILTSVAPDEAAEIVKVLEAKKFDYRLADEGRTILVARGETDRARLELVGSELAVRGQVGFELFNQSDMGLTEFAQKINYQRALQGELARTILLLQGIRSVRVHLGLPERTVFRDEQAQPKASVTLILQPGTSLTEGHVSGIQRMVAGAIPEMSPEAVSVLDGTGKVVSREPVLAPAAFGNSDAIIEGYQRRIVAAIEEAQPTLRYAVNVSLRMRQPSEGSAEGPAEGQAEGQAGAPAPRGDPDYSVNVRLTTPAPLDDSQRLELTRLIRTSAGLDRARGDAIAFLIGDPVSPQVAPPAPIGGDRIVARNPGGQGKSMAGPAFAPWAVGLAAAVIVLLAGGIVWIEQRRRRGDGRAELIGFAEQLRQRLVLAERSPS